MNSLTIFTPTYNRRENLIALYKSLLNQDCKEFTWLVIDDGSSDKTEEYIKEIMRSAPFKIEYYFQKNGGKHVAFNNAIIKCNTDFFMCVDSDDTLGNDDIKIIKKYVEDFDKIKDRKICGFVFPRESEYNKKIDFGNFDNKIIDVMDLKFYTNKNIETNIIFSTKILKKYEFPIVNNERFMSEEILYNNIAKDYKFKFINTYIIKSEYLDTGLTKNIYKNYKKNFNSTILLFKSRYYFLDKYKLNIKIKNKIKTIININALCYYTNNSIAKHSPSLAYSIMLYPISIIWGKQKYEQS